MSFIEDLEQYSRPFKPAPKREYTQEQLVSACGDACRAGIESERADIIKKLEKLVAYAKSINVNALTIRGLELALQEVKNVQETD